MIVVALGFVGCRNEGKGVTADGGDSGPEQFDIETINAYTPVKNQGRAPLCWAYAMLSAIETEHIMRGDSVHLSVK